MSNSTDPLLEALEALDARLDKLLTPALLDDRTRSMTDAEVLDFTRTVESLGRRVDAARLAAAAEIDDRSRSERGDARLSARLGCANAAELIARLTRVSGATAKARIVAARLIATRTALTGQTLPAALPALRDACLSGRLGHDTVIVIARELGTVAERCHRGELRAAESELVAAATGAGDRPPCGADETRIHAKVWSAVLDPDGALPEYERALRGRGLTLGREREGLVRLTADLVPDVAAQLVRLLHAHLSPRVLDRTPRPVTGPAFVDEPEPQPGDDLPPDDRTRIQRQHDALASILGAAARAAETPTIGGAAPTLLITVAASDLESSAGVAHLDGTESTVPSFVARHIACSGGVQRLVFDESGRIVELGGPQRVFNAAQRRAITLRDGGCVIPGCHVPAAWCEIHHVDEHARGGPTHTDNGVMLCWFHHRTLETNGWAVRMIDGVPHVRAPHWFDPTDRWHPARRSPHLEHDRLRRRRSSG